MNHKREEQKAARAYRIFRTNFLTGLEQQLHRLFKEQEMELIDKALNGAAFQVNIHCINPERPTEETAPPNEPLIQVVEH